MHSQENTISTVNTAAKKHRHERVKLFSPLFRNWAHIEREISPREKKVESSFFWRISSLGTLFFFLLSLLPQFLVTAEEFWSSPYQSQIVSFEGYDTGMVEEGFLVKPEIIDAEGDRTKLTDIVSYTIEPGDTLSAIASKFGVTSRTIMQNNGMFDANSLRAGKVLKIIPVDGVVHQVAAGDTLSKIAKKYSVKEEDILTQNNLIVGATLVEGNEVIIPGAKKELPKPPAPPRTFYTNTNIPAANTTGVIGRLLKPTNGIYTQYFHYGHWAVDIAGGRGTPVYAAEAGTVEVAAYGWSGGYGNHIIIDHGNGLKTLYGHNSQLYVSTGEYVGKGTPVAAMGNSGRVYGRTGVHLHFEVRVNGVKQNPLQYF
jgi:murein DD-endopeptidase MepM/ murein hydrolase activator NlpD